MAMEPRIGIQLKVSQKLVLTPQIQQAIKLLQMSQLELSQTLNQEMMENPFLEEAIETELVDPSITTEVDKSLVSEEQETNELTGSYEDIPIVDQISAFAVDDYFDERSSDGRDLGYFNTGTDDVQIFEQASNVSSDIYVHLIWQLRLSTAPHIVRLVAEIIIGNLDENGFLKVSVQEIAETADVDTEIAEQSLLLIQGFEPVGVGARDLKECLILQLNEIEDQDTSLAKQIIQYGFDELKDKKYNLLAEKFSVSEEKIFNAARMIAKLEPRPGRNYSNEATNYIIPDVYIVETEDEFAIFLNDDGVPKLRLSKQYRDLLTSKKKFSKSEKKFLMDKLKSASWLLKTLDQRNKTIYRVTESILKYQKDFFVHGVRGLKPLNLKDIAMELDMHESTISRVTSNKYLQCHHGIISFRYFFSSAIQSSSGEVSSESVKEIIKKIISEESPEHPLSDGKIVKILKDKNIKIARRTVAKYRDELRIPSVNQRKKVPIVI